MTVAGEGVGIMMRKERKRKEKEIEIFGINYRTERINGSESCNKFIGK